MAIRHLFLYFVLCTSAMTASAQFGVATPFAGGNSQDGNMFDIVAARDILITGFDVNVSADTQDVEVWIVTAGTSFVGSETTMADWTQVGVAGVSSGGLGEATSVQLDEGIPVAAGQTLGIYLTTPSFAGVMGYTNGVDFGGTAAQDHSVTIKEGVGVSYPFASIFGSPTPGGLSRIFNGRVRYDVIGTSSTGVTGFVFQAGNMFDIVTNEPVVLRSIDTHLSVGVHDVEVYITNTGSMVGKTMDSSQWTLIGSTTVEATAAAQLTSIPLLFDEVVTGTRGLYVTTVSTSGCNYESGNNSGGVAADDGTMQILEGIAKVYPFGANLGTTTPGSISRIWNGTIRYSRAPMSVINEGFDGIPGSGSDEAPSGWIQDLNEATGFGSNWEFRDDSPASSNGPFADNSGSGNFAHTEDSTPSDHGAINLLTPPVIVSTFAPTLEFFVNSNDAGSTQNLLAVDVIEQPAGTVHRDIVLQIGETGGLWTPVRACLTPWIGRSVQIRFRGRTDGGSFNNDVGIDDVTVNLASGSSGFGQPPQAGLAVLDINAAGATGTCRPVSSLHAGPYRSISHPGETLDITISSEPSVPLLFFAAPLNVGVLPLGPIGQLDIGNAALNNLVIIGDGNATDFYNSLWRTTAAGDFDIVLPTPAALAGFALGFQGITFNSSPSAISLTNAVEVTVIP